jgi:hypothetical protein
MARVSFVEETGIAAFYWIDEEYACALVAPLKREPLRYGGWDNSVPPPRLPCPPSRNFSTTRNRNLWWNSP